MPLFVSSPGAPFTTTPVSASPYVLLSSDVCLLVDTSGGAISITLPAPATAGNFQVKIKDAAGTFPTNPCTLNRAAGGNIDGVALNAVLDGPWNEWLLVCNGTNWFLL